MARLLVSVRSAAEAESALQGGADFIDVKEPARGPLGKAPPAAVREVVAAVAGRAPVTAALGELREWQGAEDFEGVAGVSLYKLGLSGQRGKDWRAALECWREVLARRSGAGLVAAAYADWRRAEAPDPEEVLEHAALSRLPYILLDTFEKQGATLLDALPAPELGLWVRRAREAGLQVALAGSLRAERIEELLALEPDLIAVRGAATACGRRTGTVERAAVERLARAVAGAGLGG
jgi:uncharacterized protein (UPF0264 family)